ncbi:mechanosensitive ion channel family protein [Aurantibacter aestuarii]|uniref:Mechanosensitive ion channel protein MscS n=1 Tax=Aurantibacter aestuarii TaxID=1266046 RepID=A0A2T1N8P4_9FLAO|nr:mechanosensitive ion channel family protein [Aurantibacter aestuarii]PSG88203.1 mechanosensitive ion channel protein MscS [Aurantibacter aestuarii]
MMNNFIYAGTSAAIDKLWEKLIGWYEAIILKLPNMIVSVLVLIFFYIIAKYGSKFLHKLLSKRIKSSSIVDMITKLFYAVVIMIGFFIALGILELDKALTSILAGAGVVALAIGLALQGTLNNTFSGVLLSFLPRIRIDDYIETADHSGFVQEISLRNVILRRPDNHIVVMPNSLFIDEPFVNYSLTPRSRITVSCGVGYESNLREVKEMVLNVIKENFPQNEGEGIEFYWLEFGDSSINFMTRFYVDYIKKSQMYSQQSEAIMLIKEVFDANDINIPFPIRTLQMDTPVSVQNKTE